MRTPGHGPPSLRSVPSCLASVSHGPPPRRGLAAPDAAPAFRAGPLQRCSHGWRNALVARGRYCADLRHLTGAKIALLLILAENNHCIVAISMAIRYGMEPLRVPGAARCASRGPCGQECRQIVSQWVWNLRLELGHLLAPAPVRTTEFAPALAAGAEDAALTFGYAPPEAGLPWKAGRFSGRDFASQADGTLRCPAGKTLRPTEQRREADGTLRVLFAARIRDCRGCQVRGQCQWHGATTTKPRRVSLLLHPLGIGAAPVLWKGWSRRQHRQALMQLCRSQRIEMQVEPASQAAPAPEPSILSRARRAHYRLSWAERLARNARSRGASQVRIKLFGIPAVFAASLGLATT